MNSIARAVGVALIGDVLPEPPEDVRAIVAWLESSGWDIARITALREERLAVESQWPFPLPDDVAAQLPGKAQFYAVLLPLVHAVQAYARSAVVRDRPLTTAERRLLDDVPPHYGHH